MYPRDIGHQHLWDGSSFRAVSVLFNTNANLHAPLGARKRNAEAGGLCLGFLLALACNSRAGPPQSATA
jgi:hypothetical protein